MIGAFNFEDGGRTYTCTVEQSRTKPPQAWWWFGVTGDGQRYAPFHASSSDTQGSVKTRVIAYYAALLERRAQPAVARHHWARRAPADGAATTTAAPAAAPADVEAAEE
ncbi:MAG: hypothetical protein ABJD07_17175 [Gemmatimonadaceae bacterium]